MNCNDEIRVFKFPIENLKYPNVRELLCRANLIMGRDIATSKIAILYGRDLVDKSRRGDHRSDLLGAEIQADLSGPQLEYLCFAVIRLKGTCCFPGAMETYEAGFARHKVKFRDAESGRTVSIPASELTPDTTRVRIVGKTGDVWLDRSERVVEGEIRHPHFSPEVIAQMSLLRDAFREVYPMTLEEWEEGFRMDMHPEREIALWLHMRRCYLHFTESRVLSIDQKEDIFNMIVMTTIQGSDFVARNVRLRTLSKKRVREIAAFVQGTWAEATWPDVPTA